MDFLVKNFWLLSLGMVLSAVISAILETPTIPNSTHDNILCLVHLVSVVSVNLLWTASTRYISAVNIAILCSLEVPFTIVAQVTFLTEFGREAQGPLQIIGAIIVFVAVFAKPVLEIFILVKE